MAIISTFFKTRTEARNAKVDFGGKIVDNGSNAEAGKRWELQYEGAPVTEAIKAIAEVLKAEVIDVPKAEVTPRNILGLPQGVKSNKGDRQIVMMDRKNHAVMVTHKRRFNIEA